ncbi:hypothetical protein BDR04DRAFT_1122132 [Suillus decipiens]|nr:hypothetical protein BDR04DRAFT_1122132 [Suillus decipiens]
MCPPQNLPVTGKLLNLQPLMTRTTFIDNSQPYYKHDVPSTTPKILTIDTSTLLNTSASQMSTLLASTSDTSRALLTASASSTSTMLAVSMADTTFTPIDNTSAIWHISELPDNDYCLDPPSENRTAMGNCYSHMFIDNSGLTLCWDLEPVGFGLR